MKKLLILAGLLIVLIIVGQKTKLLPEFRLDKYINLSKKIQSTEKTNKETVVYQESVITKVVEDTLPSVVTVGISKTTITNDSYEIYPTNPLNPFKLIPGQKQKIEQNIGSGFIVSKDGLIITNKHVVSDTTAAYKVLTNNNKTYTVEKIYRDPLNDLAILKMTTASGNFKPVPLGDSSSLKLGQLTIAIGTPLGEFQNTVTSGIISGLGRGITAGSPFEGYVEKLDNVIQTDAAISPGNSGGPLLNSSGQVIGVNAAIAQEGQNIGFAIPVNVVKELINNFNKQGGSFERPYIGIKYKMIDQQSAILNDLVEGAYITTIISKSPAEKAGLQEEDIIIEFDKNKVKGTDEQSLGKMILSKKIGDKVTIKIWRNKQTLEKTLTLEAYSG